MVKTLTTTTIEVSADDVRRLLSEHFAQGRQVDVGFFDEDGNVHVEKILLTYRVEEEHDLP